MYARVDICIPFTVSLMCIACSCYVMSYYVTSPDFGFTFFVVLISNIIL